ncbi:MAG: cell envelope integrity protein TolA [Gammaproteobacteria bacterium]
MSSNLKVTPDSAFKRALNKSLVLHGLLIIIVIARVSFPSSPTHAPAASTAMTIENNPTPIQATVIDSKALDAEVARQEKAKADVLAKAAAEKQRLINEQKKLEQARAAEEKRLADVQAKKKAAEVALKAEQKRIADAKKKADEAKVKQLAAEKAAKAVQDKAKMQADAASKAKAQKEAELAKAIAADRMVMDADNAAAMSGQSLREIDRYKLMVQQQIMRYWFVQGAPDSGASTQLFVRVAPNGTVLDVKISRSSGNDALDRSAMAAVFKASPLPVPQDPALFSAFRELRLTLRPDAVVSEG